MIHAQPWLACWVPALTPESAAAPVSVVAPLFLEAVSVLPPVSLAFGFTWTLTGVGCVLKTGIWQSSNVRVPGMSNSFPMQNSRTLSPTETSGRSDHSGNDVDEKCMSTNREH